MTPAALPSELYELLRRDEAVLGAALDERQPPAAPGPRARRVPLGPRLDAWWPSAGAAHPMIVPRGVARLAARLVGCEEHLDPPGLLARCRAERADGLGRVSFLCDCLIADEPPALGVVVELALVLVATGVSRAPTGADDWSDPGTARLSGQVRAVLGGPAGGGREPHSAVVETALGAVEVVGVPAGLRAGALIEATGHLVGTIWPRREDEGPRAGGAESSDVVALAPRQGMEWEREGA